MAMVNPVSLFMELKSITRKSGISLVGFNRLYSISIGRSCDQLNFHTINSSLAAELAIKSLLRNLIFAFETWLVMFQTLTSLPSSDNLLRQMDESSDDICH